VQRQESGEMVQDLDKAQDHKNEGGTPTGVSCYNHTKEAAYTCIHLQSCSAHTVLVLWQVWCRVDFEVTDNKNSC